MDADAEVVEIRGGLPVARVEAGEFKKPPEFELIVALVEEGEDGFRYRGEIGGGAIAHPVQPKTSEKVRYFDIRVPSIL